MKFRRYIPAVVLAACCVALWLAPPVRPLADDSERNVRARVVAVDNGDISLTGLLE